VLAAKKATQTPNARHPIQTLFKTLSKVWNEILKIDIADDTDFFATGAGSMDVVRLVEEVKDKAGISITNEDVFMATAFGNFIQTVVKAARGGSGIKDLEFEAFKMHVNKMDISFATQCFINGEFYQGL
jgi:formyltetrahydrofolate dehydrogenase